jgi:hypothetical protein
MSGWVMLAVAGSAYLGSYTTEGACRNAVRERLAADVMPLSVQRSDPALRAKALEIVAKTQQYQNDYICLPKSVD